MSKQYFSIQQLSFDIGFSSKEKGYELQNRVSRLYHQQLHALLQNFFYKTVPQHTLIRKDSLLLDLGSLSYNELESELPERLEKALAAQFPLLLLNEKNGLSDDAKGFESVPAETGYEFLLEFFLNTGMLPWQASGQSQITWQHILQELYQHDRNTLSGLLYKLGRQQAVRIRLAFQSTGEDMQQIITAIEPVEAPYILSYKEKIEKIQQEKQLVRSDAPGFRQAIAYFILTYLLEEKESLFSKKAFIKSVLHQMAAHYNISFTGLLEMLYEALPVETPAGSSHSLFVLVQTLYTENSSSNAMRSFNSPFPVSKGQEYMPSEKGALGLLEYFLVTGQWPAKSVFTWRAVLKEGYEHDRNHLHTMLRRLGRRFDVRRRLAYQSTEEDLQKIFEVIEPAEAPAIISFQKNVVALQQEKQLVIAGGADFRRAVSLFILTYLLEERESIFSKRMFIKSVIRQMADHYNVAYPDLLAVLYEAVPVEKISNPQQASFFQTIQEIYREENTARIAAQDTLTAKNARQALLLGDKLSIIRYYLQQGTLPPWSTTFSREEIGTYLATLIKTAPATVKALMLTVTNTTEVANRVSAILTPTAVDDLKRIMGKDADRLPMGKDLISSPAAAGDHKAGAIAHLPGSIPDVLHYFLQYGAMPWWGTEQSHHSPETLLRQLYAHSVQDALGVLKRAGMQERSKQRFVWQFSESLLYQVFSCLPEWNKVTDVLEQTIQLIETIPAFGRITQQSLKYLLLEAAWSSYIAQGYTAFNDNYFYALVFERLAYLTTIKREEIIPLFHAVISQEKKGLTNAGSYEALLRFEQAIHFFSAGNAVITVEPAHIITGNMQHGSLDSLVRRYAGTTATPSGGDRLLQVINILEYYLTWNRFPDSLLPMNWQELDDHLEAMLLLLYHENPGALKRILASEKHSVTARMHLHHLFPASKGGAYKQVNGLLDDYLEKDALQYIKEMTGDTSIKNEGGLKEALDYLLEKAKAGKGEGMARILQSTSLTGYISREYDDQTIQWLIENRPGIDKNISRQTAVIRGLLSSLVTSAAAKNRLLLLLNEVTLLSISGTHPLKNIQEYIQVLFRFLSHSASIELLRDLLRTIKAGINLPGVDAALIQLIRQQLEQHLQQKDREETGKKQLEASARKKEEETTKALQRQLQQELQKQQEQAEQAARQKQPPRIDKAEKLYITNAGLVLLHPFLSTYFTRLHLLEKGQFVNLEAQARAVHLLQYLAYNTTEHPEHELVLNKILCNYPLHEPLPLEITLQPHEIDLSAELLQVVIQRAGKLSSSTVDGFRVSFLHREGVLTETDEDWTLRVEQRGYDMMLQMLPWAFGMVRFSWMDKPVTVEWV